MQGLDLLALGHKNWPMQMTLETFPRGFALGFFSDDTFGPNALKNAIALAATGKVAAIRDQMHWSYGHKIVPMDKLKRELPIREALAQRLGIPIYLSHSCEYREDNRSEIAARVKAIRQLAPSCIPVQTPMNSYVVPAEIVEVHGQQPARAGQIASTDGEALFDMNANLWNILGANAIIRFAWGARFNGSEVMKDHGPLPPGPQRKAFPDARYMMSLVELLQLKGIAPTPTFSGVIKPFKRPTLYKSHAEDNPGDSARDNRPLVILPKKTKDVKIVTFQGEPIGKFVYWDRYPGGMHRFYSGLPGGVGLYGYEIAQKAKTRSGSEFVWFQQGDTFWGPVNPTNREGYFQS